MVLHGEYLFSGEYLNSGDYLFSGEYLNSGEYLLLSTEGFIVRSMGEHMVVCKLCVICNH
ncbi:hypothetical protein HanXRQr2_Chr12g0537601 [Helianthus annuus]|uniref:Uncharacterized protein n=1 Tax=Helianthus annuus TaxID=4232 RepID=A0A9K3HFZ7_HELAN|nr:hypothetical protein HanXRQr2_Chr12g0537601 [Helianthus annuus]KAJ0862382.1 hypothetical protein HanPSC8_Chr12g0517511 [Helianthus annuus]